MLTLSMAWSLHATAAVEVAVGLLLRIVVRRIGTDRIRPHHVTAGALPRVDIGNRAAMIGIWNIVDMIVGMIVDMTVDMIVENGTSDLIVDMTVTEDTPEEAMSEDMIVGMIESMTAVMDMGDTMIAQDNEADLLQDAQEQSIVVQTKIARRPRHCMWATSHTASVKERSNPCSRSSALLSR